MKNYFGANCSFLTLLITEIFHVFFILTKIKNFAYFAFLLLNISPYIIYIFFKNCFLLFKKKIIFSDEDSRFCPSIVPGGIGSSGLGKLQWLIYKLIQARCSIVPGGIGSSGLGKLQWLIYKLIQAR